MTENAETKNNKITLGSIASWGLGCLFLLNGLVNLVQPGMASVAVMSLIIAGMLLPPARDFVHNRTGKSISTGVRVVAIIILMVIGVSAMPGGYSSEMSSFTATADNGSSSTGHEIRKSGNTKGLEVESYDFAYGNYGTQTITGVVKNKSNKQYSYVQVEFNLYDGAGNQVGSTMANVNNLEPGGSWKFSAPILNSEAVSAKLKGISSF